MYALPRESMESVARFKLGILYSGSSIIKKDLRYLYPVIFFTSNAPRKISRIPTRYMVGPTHEASAKNAPANNAITGFIAKENVVGTLAVVYGLTNFIDTDELALVGGANEVAMVMGLTKVAALAYLMFNLFTPPCFAALGAMNSEMQDRKWLWGGIALQLCTGYTVAFLVYQIGTLITTGAVGSGFVPGLIAVAAFAVILVVLIQRKEKTFSAEYRLHA
jgi:hypothetical protein